MNSQLKIESHIFQNNKKKTYGKEYKNETDIVFDESFKLKISTYKNTHKTELDELVIYPNSNIIERASFSDKCEKIRNSIMNSEFKSVDKIHPNCFAVMLCILADITNCATWEDVVKIYKYSGKMAGQQYTSDNFCNGYLKLEFFDPYNVDFAKDLVGINPNSKCACGHKCSQRGLTLWTNIQDKRSLLLGNCCIAKTGIMKKSEIENAKREIENAKKQDEIKQNQLKYAIIAADKIMKNNSVLKFQWLARKLRKLNPTYHITADIALIKRFVPQYITCPCKDHTISRTTFYVRPFYECMIKNKMITNPYAPKNSVSLTNPYVPIKK